MNARIIVQLFFFLLSFYGFGAGMMDSFVVYHSWKFVGAGEFPLFHQEAGSRIIPVFVLPVLILTILLVIMFWKRPVNIPRNWVLIAFLFQLVGWASSAAIQIPLQIELDHSKDEAALHRLITTDWIRVAAWVGYIIMVCAMLIRILRINERAVVK